jgi:ferredoxin
VRIVYDREHCEGNFKCVAQDQDDFAVGEDNKADLEGGQEERPGLWTKDVAGDEAVARARAGAKACPPQVIQVIDTETGEVLEGPEQLPIQGQAPTP